jgi:hypothetical protein
MIGTNNFPDEYVAVASKSALYCIYFVLFLSINVIFMINQTISLFYVNYRV